MFQKTLSQEVRKQLQAVARPVLTDKGILLFRSGEPCRGAFLIRSGQVKLSLDAAIALYPSRTVSTGIVIGLPASVSGEPYSLTAETKTSCRLDFISRQALLNFLHQHSQAGLEILRLLSDEIFHMRKAVENGVRSGFSAKVA
ncbi:MAG TPA: cyclic nucleotide-binding domain-containing protein [Candidatus Binatia bacterium]|nr:cyclic nucleotide-binding domain-containing protein [Candidatus Binatia bacterium]